MKITDLLKESNIILNAKATSKQDVLEQITCLMDKSGNVANLETYRKDVLAREQESSTGVGESIAIPHAKSSGIKNAGLVAMVLPNGVDFDSLDNQPVKLIFLIGVPNKAENTHLDILSNLSTLLMNQESVLNRQTFL